MRASQRYDNRLMNEHTPGFIDPYKMAKHGQRMQGQLAVASMPRASKMLASEEGNVAYTLAFYLDEERFCVIEGELQSILSMRCQRCLQVFANELTCSFKVSPVKSDSEAKELVNSYDPVVVADGKLYPAELIEDELILAMPIVPMHQELNSCIDCSAIVEQSVTEKAQEPENPFQILQTLNVNKKGQQAEDK